MRSYGLKPSDLDDVEQGKQIIEGFKRADKQQWEEAQAAQGGKK